MKVPLITLIIILSATSVLSMTKAEKRALSEEMFAVSSDERSSNWRETQTFCTSIATTSTIVELRYKVLNKYSACVKKNIDKIDVCKVSHADRPEWPRTYAKYNGSEIFDFCSESDILSYTKSYQKLKSNLERINSLQVQETQSFHFFSLDKFPKHQEIFFKGSLVSSDDEENIDELIQTIDKNKNILLFVDSSGGGNHEYFFRFGEGLKQKCDSDLTDCKITIYVDRYCYSSCTYLPFYADHRVISSYAWFEFIDGVHSLG